MKKSLLALAVIAAAASANAATVYDKDGTTLGINGRIQSVYYSGNYGFAGQNDSSIQNSSRFGLEGRTQITDWVAGIGYTQWDMDSNSSNSISARDQYVGADFGEYGVLIAGKFRDAAYYAEEITDHFEDAGSIAEGNFGARRNGQIMYTYDNYGFHGQLGVQTAQNNAAIFGDKHGIYQNLIGVTTGRAAVDSGYSAALGYTFDDVLFGPLSLRAGYSYLKGQSGSDITSYDTLGNASPNFAYGMIFKNFKQANAGISWGNLDSGLYLAALYDYGKFEGLGTRTITLDNGYSTFAGNNNELKIKGYELVAGYAWDNGVSFLTGYESVKYEYSVAGQLYYPSEAAAALGKAATLPVSYTVKRIPLFVNYKINSNFNVWGEVGFNAGSDHSNYVNTRVNKNVDRTVFSVGARYTF